MASTRWSGNTASLLPDGRVLVIGPDGQAPADIWDPATESFSSVGPLLDGRMFPTMTVLPDGRVLVIGGSDESGPMASAVIWSPATYAPSDDEPITTTPNLLPGVDLVTEEVEPGVYRVLGDGAGHDLAAAPPSGVTIAPDGSVWLLRASPQDPDAGWAALFGVDAVLELGRSGTYPLEPDEPTASDFVDIAVGSEGAAWVSVGSKPQDGRWGGTSAQGRLASIDDGTWAAPIWPDGSTDVGALEATSDGAVWVARNVEDGPGPSVARIKDGERTVLPALADPSLEGLYRGPHASFAAADDGTAWLSNGRITFGGDAAPGPTGLLHYDGERWQVVELPMDGDDLHAGPLALGPDGTLWVYVADFSINDRPTHHLARLDADGWTVFSGRADASGHTLDEADGVPMLSTQFYYEARMAVDPDGRLWIAVGGDGGSGDDGNWLYPPSLDPASGPVGLLTFDGTTWHQYLRGLHVNRVDVADDGTVFATAWYGCPVDTSCGAYAPSADLSVAGLYAITPEAVAE